MKRKESFIFGLAMLLTIVSKAQWVPSVAFNSMSPQHRDWRITGQPDHGYFSILSTGSFMASNTLVHPATWLTSSYGQSSPQVDLNSIFEDFAGSNVVEANASITLFSAGFFPGKKRNTFIEFVASENVQAGFEVPADLLQLPFAGNATFNDADAATIDLTPMDASLSHFRSFGIGFQHVFGECLSAGMRIHRLHGFHHLDIEENEWGLTTNAADWSWNLQGGGRFVSSGLNSVYRAQALGQMDSLVNSVTNRSPSLRNKGWGFDAGVEMQWTKRWTSWFQFNKGGTIHWTNDVLVYEVEDFDWGLDGFDATNGGNGWVNGASSFLDSLQLWAEHELEAIEEYHTISKTNDSYVSKLPNRVVSGVEYHFLRGARDGELSMGGIIEHVVGRPTSWNIAVNARFGNGLQSTLTYGKRFGLVSTAGLSLAIPLGPFLVFAAAEGHQAIDWSHFNVVHDDEFVNWNMPTNAPYIGLQAGCVWRLKWREPKSEPQASPLTPSLNSTRSPVFDIDVQPDDRHKRQQQCVLPGKS
ncbi:MAG TPA: hypothetical protein DD635_08700 [Flavobacteriales bacterium]|nr:hypothetical protein [Flavobacteriales bacterium]